jgi:NADPH:quinone reductase-like Zn-dependent oxidoreductase
MSAWGALRRRVPIEAGQSVLVLGATGNAGTMAVQVAKRLGAGRVVGAGRDATRLAALTSVGADVVVQQIWLEKDKPGERTVLIP